MNKKHSFYIILATILLSSCLKAYEPVVVTPYSVSDVAGVYKDGSLILEKGLLDSITYKSIDDTSSFSITYYYKDTVVVSINTKSGVTNKRYKLALYGSVNNSVASVFKFEKLIVDSSFYLYRQTFDLEVKLYYPDTQKASTAVISNSSVAAKTPNVLYIENVVFGANKQPK
jgi:hypothetical protein